MRVGVIVKGFRVYDLHFDDLGFGAYASGFQGVGRVADLGDSVAHGGQSARHNVGRPGFGAST